MFWFETFPLEFEFMISGLNIKQLRHCLSLGCEILNWCFGWIEIGSSLSHKWGLIGLTPPHQDIFEIFNHKWWIFNFRCILDELCSSVSNWPLWHAKLYFIVYCFRILIPIVSALEFNSWFTKLNVSNVKLVCYFKCMLSRSYTLIPSLLCLPAISGTDNLICLVPWVLNISDITAGDMYWLLYNVLCCW